MNTSLAATMQKWIAFALGMVVAFYGLANVLPAIGDFRLGPFPMHWFRPTFFALCVALVLVDMSNSSKKTPWWVLLIGLAATAGLFWGSYEFYFVARDIDDAMFLFGTYEMWVAVCASAGALFFCWRIWGMPVAILGIIGVAYMWTGHLSSVRVASSGSLSTAWRPASSRRPASESRVRAVLPTAPRCVST